MIQDIAPDWLDNAFRAAEPEADSAVFSFSPEGLAARCEGESLILPRRADFPADTRCVYLFALSGRSCFLRTDTGGPPAGFETLPMSEIRRRCPHTSAEVFAGYTAWHLWHWRETSRYCGACGYPTVDAAEERAMVCPACGNRIYPRINPAVIVGVTSGDRLLLTQYHRGSFNALVAGFTEIGETLEQTVQREVMEEVGLRVKNIRYYRSQPWGIASDLLAGFFCEVDGDDTIRRDDRELRSAVWTERNKIRLQPNDYSLTNEMMRIFQEGQI